MAKDLSGYDAAAAGVSIISTLGTTYTQSQALKARGDYQASVAAMNARMSTFLAEQAVIAGDKYAEEISKKGFRTAAYIQRSKKQLIGAQRAAAAAQGIAVNAGSAADVQAETAAGGNIDVTMAQTSAILDAMTVRGNAWRAAWGYKQQAAEATFQGGMMSNSGQFEAQNTLLTGALKTTAYGIQLLSDRDRGLGVRPPPVKKPTVSVPGAYSTSLSKTDEGYDLVNY